MTEPRRFSVGEPKRVTVGKPKRFTVHRISDAINAAVGEGDFDVAAVMARLELEGIDPGVVEAHLRSLKRSRRAWARRQAKLEEFRAACDEGRGLELKPNRAMRESLDRIGRNEVVGEEGGRDGMVHARCVE